MTQPLQPASQLPDAELRRELADTHRLAALTAAQPVLPQQRQALTDRLAELDAEYLGRFPDARKHWPWPPPPA